MWNSCMVSASVVTIRGCETFGRGTNNIISSKTANRLEDGPFNVFMLVMPSSLRRKQKITGLAYIYKKLDFALSLMGIHYPKLRNMTHALSLSVLIAFKRSNFYIFIYIYGLKYFSNRLVASWELLLFVYAKNKGADQLISAFVFAT